MQLIGSLTKSIFRPLKRRKRNFSFADVFHRFQTILSLNNKILELMAEMGDKLSGDYIFDKQYIRSACEQMADYVYKLIYNLDSIAPQKYLELYNVFKKINSEIEQELEGKIVIPESDYTMPYHLVNRDFADVVGAKNANLAEVKNFLRILTPEGFAITTKGFQAFMEHNELWDKVRNISQQWAQGTISSNEASANIRELIKKGTFPHKLKKAIIKSLEELKEIHNGKELFLAIRSSAWGEDSEHSFAGQFLSLLNEPSANIFEAYKAILASAYSASAMEYRRQKGYQEHEVIMAVACQVMVNPQVSGVLYTLDPKAPDQDNMVIASTWGLGAPLVSGKLAADQYTVSREPPHSPTGLKIIRKAQMLIPKPEGGTELKTVPEELQTKSSLTTKHIQELAETGLMIERYFKKPQDMEFAFDEEGRLFVLQTRPLNIKTQIAKLVCDIPSAIEQAQIIMSGQGDIAQKGIAIGRVFLVITEEDLENFPEGAILVAKNTSPRFAKVIRKANAVITDIGSPTGHMATIAREFRVPTIVNTQVATKLLKQGQEITVDAEENVIYAGKVKELCYYEFSEEPFEETYEYRLLRRVLKKISPLHLLDPKDKSFNPKSCQTFHDITRFIHEKVVEEIIDMNYYQNDTTNRVSRHLELKIPLDLVVIDLGKGLKEKRKSSHKIKIHEIDSIPMRAFIEGLTSSGAWSTEPMSVDFGSFMSSLTRTFSSSLATPKFIGQNLAVISVNYANISLRLGYHFNMIDAYVDDNLNDNYAYFRFLGGVTDITRRSRRAKFIGEVLAANDFRVDLRGDLVVARIKKIDMDHMKEKLRLLGLLVAFTRQLDVQMASDDHIPKYVESFKELSNRDFTLH